MKLKFNWDNSLNLLYFFVGLFVFMACIKIVNLVGITQIIPFANLEGPWEKVFNIGLWGMLALWSVDEMLRITKFISWETEDELKVDKSRHNSGRIKRSHTRN